MRKWLWLAVLFPVAGCDIYTAQTVKQMDDNATLSRIVADEANAGKLSVTAEAYYLEIFARTLQNLSDAGHFRKPTYLTGPTTQPTTLPWIPTGGFNPEK